MSEVNQRKATRPDRLFKYEQLHEDVEGLSITGKKLHFEKAKEGFVAQAFEPVHFMYFKHLKCCCS